MNEFNAVSADELNQVEGGVPLGGVVAGVIILGTVVAGATIIGNLTGGQPLLPAIQQAVLYHQAGL